MLRRLGRGGAVLAIAAIGGLLYGGNAYADPAPSPPAPFAVEPLTPRAAFTEQTAIQFRLKIDGQSTDVIKTSDPSNMVTTKITVQHDYDLANGGYSFGSSDTAYFRLARQLQSDSPGNILGYKSVPSYDASGSA